MRPRGMGIMGVRRFIVITRDCASKLWQTYFSTQRSQELVADLVLVSSADERQQCLERYELERANVAQRAAVQIAIFGSLHTTLVGGRTADVIARINGGA